MDRKLIQRFVTVALLVSVAVVSLLGQDYKALIGRWNMISETNGDPVRWVLVLKESDGHLAAFLSDGKDEQPAKDFTYTDGVLKFKASYEGQDYDIELKATPEMLDGKWSGDGDSGKTSGSKS